MGKINNFVLRNYECKICNKTHQIRLGVDIHEGREKFPFPYIFLHGKLRNILTILYIDKDLQVRAVEVYELSEEDIFSKEQVMTITKKLINEIERLRVEVKSLHEQISELKKG